MSPVPLRLALAGLLALAAVAAAQDRDPDAYRRFFKKPETVPQFWKGVQLELDLGQPELAARHLRGLIDLLGKKPDDKGLLQIVDTDGTIAVLRLRNVRQWSSDPKTQAQARKDVDALIAQVTAAARRRAGDPGRARELIKQLHATPEEKTFAIRELHKSGAGVVPFLIEALLRPSKPEERLNLLDALSRMGPDSVAPMLAALESKDELLKLDILDILLRRHAARAEAIVPFLWYTSAAASEPEKVRSRARAVLGDFLNVHPTKLPSAKVQLTREAERYYKREVKLGDPGAVVVWRWDGKGVVQGWPGAATVPASQAEEYYGLRFARQALALDPSYRPAQVVLLSLAVDKAVQRGGITVPLTTSAPTVADLVARSSPELVMEVLERALRDRRSGVALAMIRALGERAEPHSKRPFQSSEPGLVRALYYPEPRVQMAAVEALLRIPGPPAPNTAARIVEILARMLSPAVSVVPGPKVLVAVANPEWRTRVAHTVREGAAEPVAVGTGREAMRQLREGREIELILLDSSLPMPGLAQTLAQMRADVDVGRVPIILAAVPETRHSVEIARRYRVLKDRLGVIHDETALYRRLLKSIDDNEAAERGEVAAEAKRFKMTADERLNANRAIEEKYGKARREAQASHPTAIFTLKRVPGMEAEMSKLVQEYDLESQAREASLARHVSRFANVLVVPASQLTDTAALHKNIRSQVREAGVALTPAEQSQYMELAVRYLDGLAAGDPPGYDIRPAGGRILDALRGGRLKPEVQFAAVSAASRLPGPRVQADLAFVVLDTTRPVPLRTAAATALIQNIQRQGVLLTNEQYRPLAELAREPKLDAALKEKLASLAGALRPDSRSTGERLRGYSPTPAKAPPKD